jgi:diguanylate cyclase (GGDEF)-like protein
VSIILVAEDSLVIRAVVRFQLEEEGYEVVEAGDGEEALQLSDDCQPDAILLDIEMPGIDGYEVLGRLKASQELCDIPVVFLTGRTGLADMVAGLRAGAHDYLRKPFEEAELIARIGAAVRVKNLQDQLRHRNEQLDRISRTDALTGVNNRRHLEELLRTFADSVRRADHDLAVLLLDLDHFKQVNDTAGHAAGDAVLREFARRLRAALRAEDIPGRWGGEEFLVLLPRTDMPTALAVAEDVRRAVAERPVDFEDSHIRVTVSIGCAVGLSDDPEAILSRADMALYRAKASGRNRVLAAADLVEPAATEGWGAPEAKESLEIPQSFAVEQDGRPGAAEIEHRAEAGVVQAMPGVQRVGPLAEG